MDARRRYNGKDLGPIVNTTLFIFLNRTCFNGLYRVNKRGQFNVPFGKYKNPTICDAGTIRKDSEVLRKVEILTGDFEDTFNLAEGNTLFYFDPPYRPLSDTSSFNDYTKDSFNDDSQVRLKNIAIELIRLDINSCLVIQMVKEKMKQITSLICFMEITKLSVY